MNSSLTSVVAALAWVSAACVALPAAAASMPEEQHQGDVSFVSGGVGQDEAKLFKEDARNHRLQIAVLQKDGDAKAFTADADVRIADENGQTVLDTQTQGPYTLVDLPPGRYTVTATLNNQTLKKSDVQITPDTLALATFEFPQTQG